MPSITLSPQARIAALVGVLLIALTGSAIYFMQGHSQATTVTTPVVRPNSTPSKHVVVAQPKVNPLLPAPLRAALEQNRIVVVGFYNPNSPVDQLTIAEARAGAEAAHVAFVPVNLLNDAVAGPLTAILPTGELLPNPGFAIYRRPGALVYRSDGYLTQAAVAQAVKDAQ